MKWTKITDDGLSLPIPNQDILVFCKPINAFFIAYIDFQLAEPTWYHSYAHLEKIEDVTHWSPLEKPKDAIHEYARFASDEALLALIRNKNQ